MSYDVLVNVLYEGSAINITLDQNVLWSDGTTSNTKSGKEVTFKCLSTAPTNISFQVNGSTTVSHVDLYKRHHIGSSAKEWDALFVKDVTISELVNIGGDVVMESDLHVKGDIRVDGNAFLSAGANGMINVGDTATDVVVFNADVDSDIQPDKDITYDLGSNNQQWNRLFVKDISATGDTHMNGVLDVDLDTTLHSDLTVSGHTTVGGDTILSGTLDVDDATYVYDTLDCLLYTSPSPRD